MGSLAVTIAALQVITPVPPPAPAIPAAVTKAYEPLLDTCRSVGVPDPKWVVEPLRAAHVWVRRSSRYASLVGQNQEVKDALATILEENSKVFLTSIAANMDNRLDLNLTDSDNASTGSSASGQSPVHKRARVGPPVGSSS